MQHCNSPARKREGGKYKWEVSFFTSLPERATELVVVHVGLGLLVSPHLGHLVRLDQLDLAAPALPRDDVPVPVRPGQQLEQELPQLDLAGARGGARWQELSVVVLGYF